MAIATVEISPGVFADFEVPDDATEEQVLKAVSQFTPQELQQVVQQFQAQQPQPAQQAAPFTPPPLVEAPAQPPGQPAGQPMQPPAQAPIPTGETLQERALRLGAQPGVALTPEQERAIALNQRIDQKIATLTPDIDYRPIPEQQYMDPLARAWQQGVQNIGSGILRGVGELRQLIGDEEAQRYLDNLAVSINVERQKTIRATADNPVAGFVGEVLGEATGFGGVGGGATIPLRLLTAAVTGAIGAGLSAAGRGEEAGEIQKEAAIGGVLGGITEGILKAGGSFMDFLRDQRRLKKEAKALGFESESAAWKTMIDEIERGVEVSEATGIDLLPAQITRDPFQKQQTAFLGQNPEVSRQAFDVLSKQNEQAADAVESLLNEIAVPVDVATAPARGKKAATNIIDAAELIRQERVSPIYEGAFRQAKKQGLRVDVDPVISMIRDMKNNYGEVDQMGRILDKMEDIIGGPGTLGSTGTPEEIAKRLERSTLRRMHGIKMANDKRIQGHMDKGNIDKSMERDLNTIQKKLLDQMDALGVGYKRARNEYSAMQPTIDDLRDGIIGGMSRITDAKLKNISGILFDPAEGTVGSDVMKNAIKTLKSVEGGHQIASGLLRVELQKRMARASSRIGGTDQAAVANVPQELYKGIFGKNRAEEKLLFDALKELNPDMVPNARFLQEALTRAGEARPGGSPTGIRQVITERLRGPWLAFADWFRQPLDQLIGLGEDAQFNAKANALGEALYNPAWKPDMDKIREIGPKDPRAVTALQNLLNKIITYSVKVGEISLPIAERIAVAGEVGEERPEFTPPQQPTPQELQQQLQQAVQREQEAR